MSTLALSTVAWTFLAVGIYLAIALPFAYFLGRAVRHNTADPPEPEDWLTIDAPAWEWPEDKEAA